jgi:uncharacterized protein involved in exopolysaccharide biosynthesis
LDRGINAVDKVLQVNTNRDAGTVRLSVLLRNPELAVQVANRFLDILNNKSAADRQYVSGAERRFLQVRASIAEDSLHAAEALQEAFLLRNRTILGSPELQFQQERLQRQVDLRQQLFMSISQALERARLDEVRTTPSFFVVQSPNDAIRRNGSLALDVLVWAALAIFGAATCAIWLRLRAQGVRGSGA